METSTVVLAFWHAATGENSPLETFVAQYAPALLAPAQEPTGFAQWLQDYNNFQRALDTVHYIAEGQPAHAAVPVAFVQYLYAILNN